MPFTLPDTYRILDHLFLDPDQIPEIEAAKEATQAKSEWLVERVVNNLNQLDEINNSLVGEMRTANFALTQAGPLKYAEDKRVKGFFLQKYNLIISTGKLLGLTPNLASIEEEMRLGGLDIPLAPYPISLPLSRS